VRDEAGATVRQARSVTAGAALSVQFADGRIGVVADADQAPEKGGSAQPAETKPSRQKTRSRGGQGSLF